MDWLGKELQLNISQKFMDMGNLAIAALTFGSVLAEKPMQWWVFTSGIILWFLFYVLGVMIGKGGDN
ncbi:MAG: hypothetical protein ABH886_04315 [Candidatus Desantisbacteria bacterium]